MKVLQYFIVLLTVCMSITSCSKDDKVDDLPNKGADDEEQLSYELKQPVIALEEEQLNYIVKAVDDTLFFKGNTPKKCLPGIGTLLLENHDTESLPYGFYGKVMKIEEVHGLQAVIAEPLPLPEVFSELRLNRPINFSDYGAEFISEEGEVIQLHSTTRKGETEVGFPISVTGKYVGVTGTASLAFELLEFKLPDILSNEARISARATLKYGLSLTASISETFNLSTRIALFGNLLTNMKEEGEDHLTQITYQSDVTPNTTVNIPYFMVFRYDDDTVSSSDNAILCYAAMLNILGKGPCQLMKSLEKAGKGYNNSFSFSYVWDEYGNLTGIQDYSVYSGDDSSGESYKAQIGLTYY